jgi:hypothetical protein
MSIKISEVSELLDDIYMPFKKEQACIDANRKLTADEVMLLLDIVLYFELNEERLTVEDVTSALEGISPVMQKYVNEANHKANNTSGKIALKPDAMPFLVKQVLFYIAVQCKRCKIKGLNGEIYGQADIIDYINGCGVPISHNFFSRMSRTPDSFVKMLEYRQPKLPIPYKGQKHGLLSLAIKKLSYQCGKYDGYVDLFGGSGAASLAVEKRKGVKYVYNELHRTVNNLFSVIADDNLHKELIKELKLFQDDLNGVEGWITEDEVDFEQEIEKYYNSRKRRTPDEDSIVDMKNNELFVIFPQNQKHETATTLINTGVVAVYSSHHPLLKYSTLPKIYPSLS